MNKSDRPVFSSWGVNDAKNTDKHSALSKNNMFGNQFPNHNQQQFTFWRSGSVSSLSSSASSTHSDFDYSQNKNFGPVLSFNPQYTCPTINKPRKSQGVLQIFFRFFVIIKVGNVSERKCQLAVFRIFFYRL